MKKSVWIPGLCVVIVGGLFLANYLTGGLLWRKAQMSWPALTWKKYEGCVVSGNQTVNYEFRGKRNWALVTSDMGCGQTYQDAQSWGIMDGEINGETADIAQFTILSISAAPEVFDEDVLSYVTVSESNNAYLELGRVTVHDGDKEYGITDGEWEYLKDSFKAK